MPSVDLNRRRILVVEDDAILAMSIMDEIEDHNGVVQELASTLQQGFKALERERPDACILNIRLGREMVYELADRLLALGIPFIFASSEAREHIPDRFDAVPLHSKPIDMIKAAAGLMGQVSSQSGT